MLESSGMKREDAVFAFCVTVFGVVLVLTNIVGVKLFTLFPAGRPAWMPGAGPLTLTDGDPHVPPDVPFDRRRVGDLGPQARRLHGRRRVPHEPHDARHRSAGARALPPSEFWVNAELGLGADALQDAFTATFYYPSTLLFASMTAYLVAQLLDVRLYHFWWRVTAGRHMWIRNNGSTMLSQLVDTIIVNSIFLRRALGFEWGQIAEIILAVYLCKLVLAAIDTPIIYLWRRAAAQELRPAHHARPPAPRRSRRVSRRRHKGWWKRPPGEVGSRALS